MVNQPKIKMKVVGSDRDAGEVANVIVDPVTKFLSHIVVRTEDGGQRVVPLDQIADVSEGVRLRCSAVEVSGYPPLCRDDYTTVHEQELAGLEARLDVDPGHALLPVPEGDRDIPRRSFFTKFTIAINAVLALPLAYPVFKFLIHPMYGPFDNTWVTLARTDQFQDVDTPKSYRFRKTLKEGYLERTFDKSHWAMKASPETLEAIYQGKDVEFRDQNGDVYWVNRRNVPYVVFSGKCPHLGCGYKWRSTKKYAMAFLCPCHLSIYDIAGTVLTGPAPRPLDVLPTRVTPGGDIETVDIEFKAGLVGRVRVI